MRALLPATIELMPQPDRALLALQGPKAAAVLSRLDPRRGSPKFYGKRFRHVVFHKRPSRTYAAWILSRSRSRARATPARTGSKSPCPRPPPKASRRLLLAEPEVLPIGLGARDTLRLEAGLPLYGQDMDETTSPVEAGLAFSIGKRRRAEGGFPGAERILRELSEGPGRIRVGLKLEGRAAARTHMKVADASRKRDWRGHERRLHADGGGLDRHGLRSARPRRIPARKLLSKSAARLCQARIVPMPFVPHNYARRV